jgi:hypothetical protein
MLWPPNHCTIRPTLGDVQDLRATARHDEVAEHDDGGSGPLLVSAPPQPAEIAGTYRHPPSPGSAEVLVEEGGQDPVVV